MLAPDERIVLLHIPKCAGTVVHNLLAEQFAPSEVIAEKTGRLQDKKIEVLLRARLISGHFNWFEVGRVPGPKKVITVLRAPVERILSLYYFWKAHPARLVETANLLGPKLARSMSLAQFLASPEPMVRHHVDNTLVRRLIGRSTFGQGTALAGRDPDFCVEVAFANLERMNFVAFQQTLDADVDALMDMFGLARPMAVPRVNVRADRARDGEFDSVEPEEISDEVREQLDRLTVMDAPLYRRAQRERLRLRSPYPS